MPNLIRPFPRYHEYVSICKNNHESFCIDTKFEAEWNLTQSMIDVQ